jgi:biotin carboxyl carrier protein
VIADGGTLEEAVRRAVRALAEFDIAGAPVNVALLQAPGLGTHEAGWVDAHAAAPAAAVPAAEVPPGHATVSAPLAGTVGRVGRAR